MDKRSSRRGPDRSDTRQDACRARARSLHIVDARAAPASEPRLIDIARSLYQARRLRAKHVQTSLLADPAWDILLDAYVRHCLGEKLSVSSACIAADVPTTTALRCLTNLEHEGLIERRPSAHDRRVVLLSLSSSAHAAMTAYLVDLSQKWCRPPS